MKKLEKLPKWKLTLEQEIENREVITKEIIKLEKAFLTLFSTNVPWVEYVKKFDKLVNLYKQIRTPILRSMSPTTRVPKDKKNQK